MERTPTQIEDDDREAELMRKAEEFKETIRSAKAALDAEKSGDDSSVSTNIKPDTKPKETVSTDNKLEQLLPSLPKKVREEILRELETINERIEHWTQEGSEELIALYEETKKEIQSDPKGFYTKKITDGKKNIQFYVESEKDDQTQEDREHRERRILSNTEDITKFEEIISALETDGGDSAEVEKVIENLPPEERKKLGLGIITIGFSVEKWKNDKFAKAYDWFSKTKDDKGNLVPKKGALANFLRARSKRHKINEEVAETKITSAVNTPKTSALFSAAYLGKNIFRLGGWIAAFTGAAPAWGYRIAMTASVAAPSVAGDMKEARFRNEELVESTRIELEQAEEEAWAIYKKAGGEFITDESGNINSANSEEISSERLKKAYLEKMPEDLQKRLGISDLAESVFKTKMRKDVDDLSNQIQTIEKNSSLSPEQIKAQTSNLLKSWEEKLNDYDRALTQLGTVDQMAIRLRNLETGAKYFLRGMTAYTMFLSAEKAWDMFSHWSNGNIPDQTEDMKSMGKTLKNGAKALAGKGSNPGTTPTPADATGHPETTATQTPMGTNNEAATGATEAHAEQAKNAVKQAAGKIAETSATPAPEVSNVEITGPTDPAVVQQGKGIEHAFIKQIKGDPRMAEALGYKKGAEDLHKFAGRMAHRIALENGYVDEATGDEIYVKNAGEAAYKLIPTGEMGHASVQEFHKEGTEFVEQKLHHTGDAFEEKPDAYEMRHAGTALHTDKTPEVPATPTETPAQTAVYDQNRLATPEEIRQNLESLGFTGGQTEDEILEHAKSIGYHNPGDATLGEELHKKIADTLDSASQTTAPKTETVAEMLPIFKENMYNLQTPTLRTINEIHLTNLKKLFPENMLDFRTSLEKIKFDEFNETFNPNGQVAQYVKTLQKVTGEKPKMGIFGLFNKETVGHYIARALQYAGTKPGMLDKLKL